MVERHQAILKRTRQLVARYTEAATLTIPGVVAEAPCAFRAHLDQSPDRDLQVEAEVDVRTDLLNGVIPTSLNDAVITQNGRTYTYGILRAVPKDAFGVITLIQLRVAQEVGYGSGG